MDGGRDETLTWTVAGMDCAGCATKIRGVLERLPGVSHVVLSVTSERLTLDLGAATTPPERIEQAVSDLGYSLVRGAGEGPPRSSSVPPDSAPEPRGATPWHATGYGTSRDGRVRTPDSGDCP